jgi:uncharacterized protein DUF3558
MTVRTRLPLVFAVVGMVVVSGCSVPSVGTPLPASSTQTSSAGAGGDLPSDGAPKVDNPLDASHFEQHPCDVLKPDDAKTLNLPPTGKQESTAVGEACSWRNSETRGTLHVTFFSSDERGLSSVYQEAQGAGWQYFERIDDVEGQPAVAFNQDEKTPKYGCVVVVGVSDQLVFASDVALSDANVGHTDPCGIAAKASGTMVNTMREAA